MRPAVRFPLVLAAAVACSFSCSSWLDADDGDAADSARVTADPGPDWGSLQIQFLYNGEAPEPEVIMPIRGAELCGKFKIIDEELLVDPKTKGLANVVVTLNHKRRELPKELPAVVQQRAEKPIRMTNKACRFEPHVCVLWTEQTLELANDDPDVHNMLANLIFNAPFNQVIQPGKPVQKKLALGEKYLCDISCSIHPFMKGWLVVKDHPYAGVSNRTGDVTIAHIPVGEWEFQLWHERPGYLSSIEVNGKPAAEKKGIYQWKIGPGKNEPLRIVLDPKDFAAKKK